MQLLSIFKVTVELFENQVHKSKQIKKALSAKRITNSANIASKQITLNGTINMLLNYQFQPTLFQKNLSRNSIIHLTQRDSLCIFQH